MSTIFSGGVLDVSQDVFRNIVSLRVSQDLFDDLSSNQSDWLQAQRVEDEVKPTLYRSATPIIDRPFEDAAWFNAIGYPFKNWQSSRFSDGSFGVWYGAAQLETSAYECAYHWYYGLIRDAGFEEFAVVGERKVYRVDLCAALLDLRKAGEQFPDLTHRTDYRFAQSIGARLHREGHPGLIATSVRHPGGENFAVFNRAVLTNPRHACYLSYRVDHQNGERFVAIEKTADQTWLQLPVS